jgi:hypothetical protein
VRPNLFSLALFAFVLVLLERRRFDWLLLVSWLWMVVHRAALLGYVLLAARAAHLVFASAVARWPRLSIAVGPGASKRNQWVAVAVAAAAPVLGLANPSGARAFVSAVDLTTSALQRAYIAEWHRLGWGAFATVPGAVGLGVLLLALARMLVAVRRRRRAPVDAWHLGLLAVLAGLAMDRARWLPYLAVAAGYVVVLLAAERAPTGRRAAAGTLLAALALPVVAFAVRGGAPFALAEDATVEPAGAVAFARAHGLDGPLVHSYELGGYLLWRGFPVLVDGRFDQLYPPAFVATCIQAERHPELLAHLPMDRVTWAIGSNSPSRYTHQYLFRDPAWSMVYWSEAASVYVRRDAHPELGPFAFAVVDPAAPELSAAQAVRSGDRARIAAAHAELGRMLAESPASLRANSALAIYFHLLHRTRERDTVMQVLRTVAGDHPAVRELDRRFRGN